MSGCPIDRVHNTVGKGGSADDQNFLHFFKNVFKSFLLNAFSNKKLLALPNLKNLQTTILNLMKMAESS